MKIKCGRNEFDLTEDDVIFSNGFCYQIITRKVRKGWSEYSPQLADGKAKSLIKNGAITLVKEKMKYIAVDGREVWHRYYSIVKEVKE